MTTYRVQDESDGKAVGTADSPDGVLEVVVRRSGERGDAERQIAIRVATNARYTITITIPARQSSPRPA